MAKKKMKENNSPLTLFMELPVRNDIMKNETVDPLNNHNFEEELENNTEEEICAIVDKNIEVSHAENDSISSEVPVSKKDNTNNIKLLFNSQGVKKERIITCYFCNLSFKTKKQFEHHIKKEYYSNDLDGFNCKICINKTFKFFKSLVSHYEKRHEKPALEKSLQSDGDFGYKLKTSLCYICGKSFNHIGHYREHMLRHEDVKNYVCDVCSKSFITKRVLTIHSKIHDSMEKRKFVCGHVFEKDTDVQKLNTPSSNFIKADSDGRIVCRFSCVSKSDLNKHSLIHSNLKPYSCHICRLSFRQTGHLRRHIKRHLGTKDFACTVCRKEFVTKDNLNNHLRTHVSSHICEICGKTLLQRSQCIKHVAKCHNSKIQI